MRLILLLLLALGTGLPAGAQTPGPASPAGRPSAVEDTADQSPVSLDRIRDGLKRAEKESILRTLNARADFVVHIEEQAHIDELMKKLDFKSGPAPAGGLYAYEQQRRLFNPVSRPLQQPYAAFSGGEFITKPIKFSGKHLLLNFSTSAAGSIRAELQDAEGKPLPGFSLDECEETFGDSILRAIFWKSGNDISTAAGKPVRLRITMKDADVFSFRFAE